MSNYNGQEGFQDSTPRDGRFIFTERHSKLAHAVLSTGTPNFELTRELRDLATQQPFPSHRAAMLLDAIAERGLAYSPDYDQMMSTAWQADGSGFPHLTQRALAAEGIRYEFIDDGK